MYPLKIIFCFFSLLEVCNNVSCHTDKEALATAAAVGTNPISPTPFAPCGPFGSFTSIPITSIRGVFSSSQAPFFSNEYF